MTSPDLERLMLHPFPPSPLPTHSLMQPLSSAFAIAEDAEEMSFTFESWWVERVYEGVAYFFRWTGNTRATVLLVIDRDRVTHVECQGCGGTKIEGSEFQPIGRVLQELCHQAGLRLWEHDRAREH